MPARAGLKTFGADDIIFIPYRRLRDDPEGVLADIERHIGVSPHSYPNARAIVHETTKVPVPDSAVAMLRELVDADARFIATEFGSEFAAMT